MLKIGILGGGQLGRMLLQAAANYPVETFVLENDKECPAAHLCQTIKLAPYDRECLGSNSYDVHLGKWLATYREHILDAKKHNEIEYFEMPDEGFVLYPHIFYLGVTLEYTETHAHVPFLEGKSSTGRLGIDIHATAGKGDVGFCGHWTLEISVKQPVKVYHGMPIGQLIIFLLTVRLR
ncbi:MAG: dCTP deaminase [Chitinophagaceae bacterium]